MSLECGAKEGTPKLKSLANRMKIATTLLLSVSKSQKETDTKSPKCWDSYVLYNEKQRDEYFSSGMFTPMELEWITTVWRKAQVVAVSESLGVVEEAAAEGDVVLRERHSEIIEACLRGHKNQVLKMDACEDSESMKDFNSNIVASTVVSTVLTQEMFDTDESSWITGALVDAYDPISRGVVLSRIEAMSDEFSPSFVANREGAADTDTGKEDLLKLSNLLKKACIAAVATSLRRTERQRRALLKFRVQLRKQRFGVSNPLFTSPVPLIPSKDISRGQAALGRVTKCAYSPRKLRRQLGGGGWAAGITPTQWSCSGYDSVSSQRWHHGQKGTIPWFAGDGRANSASTVSPSFSLSGKSPTSTSILSLMSDCSTFMVPLYFLSGTGTLGKSSHSSRPSQLTVAPSEQFLDAGFEVLIRRSDQMARDGRLDLPLPRLASENPLRMVLSSLLPSAATSLSCASKLHRVAKRYGLNSPEPLTPLNQNGAENPLSEDDAEELTAFKSSDASKSDLHSRSAHSTELEEDVISFSSTADCSMLAFLWTALPAREVLEVSAALGHAVTISELRSLLEESDTALYHKIREDASKIVAETKAFAVRSIVKERNFIKAAHSTHRRERKALQTYQKKFISRRIQSKFPPKSSYDDNTIGRSLNTSPSGSNEHYSGSGDNWNGASPQNNEGEQELFPLQSEDTGVVGRGRNDPLVTFESTRSDPLDDNTRGSTQGHNPLGFSSMETLCFTNSSHAAFDMYLRKAESRQRSQAILREKQRTELQMDLALDRTNVNRATVEGESDDPYQKLMKSVACESDINHDASSAPSVSQTKFPGKRRKRNLKGSSNTANGSDDTEFTKSDLVTMPVSELLNVPITLAQFLQIVQSRKEAARYKLASHLNTSHKDDLRAFQYIDQHQEVVEGDASNSDQKDSSDVPTANHDNHADDNGSSSGDSEDLYGRLELVSLDSLVSDSDNNDDDDGVPYVGDGVLSTNLAISAFSDTDRSDNDSAASLGSVGQWDELTRNVTFFAKQTDVSLVCRISTSNAIKEANGVGMWSDAEGSDVASKDSYDSLLDSHSDSSKSSQRSVSKGRREQNQQRHRQRAVARKERETRMRQFWEHEDRAVIGRTHNQIMKSHQQSAGDSDDVDSEGDSGADLVDQDAPIREQFSQAVKKFFIPQPTMNERLQAEKEMREMQAQKHTLHDGARSRRHSVAPSESMDKQSDTGSEVKEIEMAELPTSNKNMLHNSSGTQNNSGTHEATAPPSPNSCPTLPPRPSIRASARGNYTNPFSNSVVQQESSPMELSLATGRSGILKSEGSQVGTWESPVDVSHENPSMRFQRRQASLCRRKSEDRDHETSSAQTSVYASPNFNVAHQPVVVSTGTVTIQTMDKSPNDFDIDAVALMKRGARRAQNDVVALYRKKKDQERRKAAEKIALKKTRAAIMAEMAQEDRQLQHQQSINFEDMSMKDVGHHNNHQSSNFSIMLDSYKRPSHSGHSQRNTISSESPSISMEKSSTAVIVVGNGASTTADTSGPSSPTTAHSPTLPVIIRTKNIAHKMKARRAARRIRMIEKELDRRRQRRPLLRHSGGRKDTISNTTLATDENANNFPSDSLPVVWWQLAMTVVAFAVWVVVLYTVPRGLSSTPFGVSEFGENTTSQEYTDAIHDWLIQLLPFDLITSLLFLVDTAVSCRINVKSDRDSFINRSYIRRYLIPDILSIFPFYLVLLLISDRGQNLGINVVVLVYHLRLWRLIKMGVNYFEESGRVQPNRMYVVVLHYIVYFARAFILFAGFCVFAASLHFILVHELEYPGASTSELTLPVILPINATTTTTTLAPGPIDYDLAIGKGGDTVISFEEFYTDVNTYVNSLFVIAYAVTGVGYGTYEPHSDTLRMFLAALCFISQGFAAFVVGTIAIIILELDTDAKRRHDVMEATSIALRCSLPPSLAQDMMYYFHQDTDDNLGEQFRSLASNLPPQIQTNILLFNKLNLIRRASRLFRTHPTTFLIAVAHELESMIFKPYDTIFWVREKTSTMYFVSMGVLQMYNWKGKMIFTRRRGSSFNEASVLLPQEFESPFTARSLNYAELHALTSDALAGVLIRFPKSRRQMGKWVEKLREESEAMQNRMLADIIQTRAHHATLSCKLNPEGEERMRELSSNPPLHNDGDNSNDSGRDGGNEGEAAVVGIGASTIHKSWSQQYKGPYRGGISTDDLDEEDIPEGSAVAAAPLSSSTHLAASGVADHSPTKPALASSSINAGMPVFHPKPSSISIIADQLMQSSTTPGKETRLDIMLRSGRSGSIAHNLERPTAMASNRRGSVAIVPPENPNISDITLGASKSNSNPNTTTTPATTAPDQAYAHQQLQLLSAVSVIGRDVFQATSASAASSSGPAGGGAMSELDQQYQQQLAVQASLEQCAQDIVLVEDLVAKLTRLRRENQERIRGADAASTPLEWSVGASSPGRSRSPQSMGHALALVPTLSSDAADNARSGSFDQEDLDRHDGLGNTNSNINNNSNNEDVYNNSNDGGDSPSSGVPSARIQSDAADALPSTLQTVMSTDINNPYPYNNVDISSNHSGNASTSAILADQTPTPSSAQILARRMQSHHTRARELGRGRQLFTNGKEDDEDGTHRENTGGEQASSGQ